MISDKAPLPKGKADELYQKLNVIVDLTGDSGTLTDEQFNLLNNNKFSVIRLQNSIFRLFQTNTDDLVYISFNKEGLRAEITITIENKNWVANRIPYVNKTLDDFSWAEIAQISESGLAQYYFKVGDVKTITIEGNYYDVFILGFNHDNLADGSGKAGITFMFRNAYKKSTSVKYGTSGWRLSILQSYMNTTVYNSLPTELKNAIKSVIKDSNAPTASDKLFALSAKEIGLTTDYSSGGNSQYEFFNKQNIRDNTPYSTEKQTTKFADKYRNYIKETVFWLPRTGSSLREGEISQGEIVTRTPYYYGQISSVNNRTFITTDAGGTYLIFSSADDNYDSLECAVLPAFCV